MKKQKSKIKALIKGNYGNIICLSGVLTLLFPIFILSLVLLTLHINIFDNPEFWYGYMAYFGTVTLATVSLFQTQKSESLSEKFDRMNATQNYSFSQINDLNIEITHNDDQTVTWSAFHKPDSQAIIIVENGDISEKDCLNECLFELYFNDYSKAAIKYFSLDCDQMGCIQEPNKSGLSWSGGSNDAIHTSFSLLLSDEGARPIWTSNNSFKIFLKIYCKKNGIFANMIENPIRFCFTFEAKLISVCDVVTKMRYKYWVSKSNRNFKLEQSESELLDVIVK